MTCVLKFKPPTLAPHNRIRVSDMSLPSIFTKFLVLVRNRDVISGNRFLIHASSTILSPLFDSLIQNLLNSLNCEHSISNLKTHHVQSNQASFQLQFLESPDLWFLHFKVMDGSKSNHYATAREVVTTYSTQVTANQSFPLQGITNPRVVVPLHPILDQAPQTAGFVQIPPIITPLDSHPKALPGF